MATLRDTTVGNTLTVDNVILGGGVNLKDKLALFDRYCNEDVTDIVCYEYFSTIDINWVIRIGKVIFLEFRGLLKKDIPVNTYISFEHGLTSKPLWSATINCLKGDRYLKQDPTPIFGWFADSGGIFTGENWKIGSDDTWIHIHAFTIING